MRQSVRSLRSYLDLCFSGASEWERRRREPAKILAQFLGDPANSPNDLYGRHPLAHPNEKSALSYFEAWVRTHDMDEATMRAFLDAGADPETGAYSIAFWMINGSDDPAPIALLLDAGLPLDTQGYDYGWSLFHAAAVFHSQERPSRLVPMLIERAVKAGRLDLLEAGAIRNPNVEPSTPMDIALQVGNWDTVRKFCAHVAPSVRVQESIRVAKIYRRDHPLAA